MKKPKTPASQLTAELTQQCQCAPCSGQEVVHLSGATQPHEPGVSVSGPTGTRALPRLNNPNTPHVPRTVHPKLMTNLKKSPHKITDMTLTFGLSKHDVWVYKKPCFRIVRNSKKQHVLGIRVYFSEEGLDGVCKEPNLSR